MKKQPEITALTRNNLITAFWDLYVNNKIEKISIKQVTDKAGYNRSTFYEYFTDVYDLLEQLEDNLLLHIKEQVANEIRDNPQADIAINMANLYDSKGEYLSVLLGDKGDPNFRRMLKKTMRPTIFQSFGLLQDNIRNNYIFEFTISAIISTITYWYQNEKTMPSDELVQLIRSMLLKGVYPELTNDIKK